MKSHKDQRRNQQQQYENSVTDQGFSFVGLGVTPLAPL